MRNSRLRLRMSCGACWSGSARAQRPSRVLRATQRRLAFLAGFLALAFGRAFLAAAFFGAAFLGGLLTLAVRAAVARMICCDNARSRAAAACARCTARVFAWIS